MIKGNLETIAVDQLYKILGRTKDKMKART
jgi:hypothetical protein